MNIRDAYQQGFAASPGTRNPFNGLSSDPHERVYGKLWMRGYRAMLLQALKDSPTHRAYVDAGTRTRTPGR